MVTLQTIKSELSDIRYYYARREMFEKAFDCVGKNAILEKVEKYNKAVLNAPPKLYEVYVALYVTAHTQKAAAEELNYSIDYISKTNGKLVRFFQKELSA